VNPGVGSVAKEGSTITVTCEDEKLIIREYYRVTGSQGFVYSIDSSNDGGATWNRGAIEFTMNRVA
jgi:ubiquinone/menaquinone biosynthesis C-methylase UbiE